MKAMKSHSFASEDKSNTILLTLFFFVVVSSVIVSLV